MHKAGIDYLGFTVNGADYINSVSWKVKTDLLTNIDNQDKPMGNITFNSLITDNGMTKLNKDLIDLKAAVSYA